MGERPLGANVGSFVGSSVGTCVGLYVGESVGKADGANVGSKETVGEKVLEPNLGKNMWVGFLVLVVGPANVGLRVGRSPVNLVSSVTNFMVGLLVEK